MLEMQTEEDLIALLQAIATRLDNIQEAIGSHTEEISNLSATIAEGTTRITRVLGNGLLK